MKVFSGKAVGLMIAGSVVLGVVPAQNAAAVDVRQASSAVAASAAPVSSDGFDKCKTVEGVAKPTEIRLGSRVGAGATEALSPKLRTLLNDGLTSKSKDALSKRAVAIRYLDNGAVVALGRNGRVVQKVSDAYEGLNSSPSASVKSQNIIQNRGLLNPTVKRVIGACLGFGGSGALSFEALVRYLATPQNAVKFVVRRLGVFGAVSCAGGIVWEFI